jgi:hypothetical protein
MCRFLVVAATVAGTLLLAPAAAQADGPSPAYTSVVTLAFDPSDELCPRPKVFKPKPVPPLPLGELQAWQAAGWAVGNG